uniref:Ubiquitin carboxyl-terminal hydrolase n=1 Tax=Trichobilharzia regenti TaxID=157069 RepID=A0AA85J0S8_TRIRE
MGKKNRNKRESRQYFIQDNSKTVVNKNSKDTVSVKGLHNLGNTCYFNAGIQCLSRSPWLPELLFADEPRELTLTKPDGDSVSSLSISLPPMKCTLTEHFKEISSVLRPIQTPNSKTCSAATLSPTLLRSIFIERCPRFGGFRQHDSHEFIRSLLDCMKQEELTRWKKGILLKLNVNPKDIRDDEREAVRSWGKSASVATIVDRLFGGVLISTLECCCCGTVRPRFEPFLDLSLSILETNVPRHRQNESTGKQFSKGMTSSKQLRKKERKRKTQRQRKRQNFVNDRDTDNECLNRCSSESEFHETNVGQIEKANDHPRCTYNSHSSRRSSSSSMCAADEMKKGNCNTDQYDTAEVNTEEIENSVDLNDSDRSGEPLNQIQCDESISSDGNCADIEGSDRHDSVTSLQLVDNGCDENSKPTEANNTNTLLTIVDDLKKLHLDSSTPSQLLYDPDEVVQAIHYSRIPLGKNRYSSSGDNSTTSIYDCLSKYTAAEVLTGCNRLVCDVCSKRSIESEHKESNMETVNGEKKPDAPSVLQDVIKRDLIYKPPPILTIHLKRFQQLGVHVQKSQKRINFPIYLDLSPFCSVLTVFYSNQIRYRLYGVIEHTGQLSSGHYAAYVAVSKSDEDNSNN